MHKLNMSIPQCKAVILMRKLHLWPVANLFKLFARKICDGGNKRTKSSAKCVWKTASGIMLTQFHSFVLNL